MGSIQQFCAFTWQIITPDLILILQQRSHLPNTPFDNSIDRRSVNPKFQAFEKFISGMYLGEIVRTVIVSLIDATPKPLLFSGFSTNVVNKQYGIDTALMSAVEEAWIGNDNSPDTFVLPPLGSFDESKLNAKVAHKLQAIKKILVQHLGFEEKQVSLLDAAVSYIFSKRLLF